MTIRLLLVDDHAIVRTGLRMLLENEPDCEIVGEAGTAQAAVTLADQLKPDVILMDIGLPDLTGIEATRRIKAARPEVAVVALTIHEDEEYFFKMLHVGASGYVPKRAAPDELLSAVRSAAAGEVYIYPTMAKLLVHEYINYRRAGSADNVVNSLSERESEVLAYVAEGVSTRDIAEALGISPKTVERHRENIMRELGLHSRAELVKYAIRHGIIQP
ncbi:MAG: response regulator transcription factor [Anaerolineales bacterium]|nr:response regulator transcription factor [Anaerolineales bacterium]